MNIITLNLTYHFLDFWVRVCVVCVWWEEWLNFSWKKHILCQQKNNNNLYQQLFSYTSNNFENLHCNQMPGYFWPQALTWNSVIVLKKIEPFMLILISKQLVFFPVLFYAVTKTDDLSFINWNLSQHRTNNCKTLIIDIIILLQKDPTSYPLTWPGTSPLPLPPPESRN